MRTRCPGCGVELKHVEGPVHRYLESSAACWALYGEVLAREYSDPAYMRVHRLTVDAYAVQHPGQPSPQTIQSAALHLMSLCLVLEESASFEAATAAMQAAAGRKGMYRWLDPPADRGAIDVARVHAAATAGEHADIVRALANSAWEAWSVHHAEIRAWLRHEY
jgi:hypothetical protein